MTLTTETRPAQKRPRDYTSQTKRPRRKITMVSGIVFLIFLSIERHKLMLGGLPLNQILLTLSVANPRAD